MITMNRKRMLRKFSQNTQAGIAIYVLILFGLTLGFYLFGFTNMWTEYQKDANVNLTNITSAQQ